MLALMRQNATLNDLEDKVKASVYNWGASRPPSIPEHPDVVLAGKNPPFTVAEVMH